MKRLCFALAIILLFSAFLYGCAPRDQVNLIYHKVKVSEKTNSVTIEVTVRNDGETIELDPDTSFRKGTLTSASGKTYEYDPSTGLVLPAVIYYTAGESASETYFFSDLEESGTYTLELGFYQYSYVIEDIEIQLPE